MLELLVTYGLFGWTGIFLVFVAIPLVLALLVKFPRGTLALVGTAIALVVVRVYGGTGEDLVTVAVVGGLTTATYFHHDYVGA